MSGIAGIYHFHGQPVGEELDRMLGAMEYRGPDGANTWREGSVGFGHLMLETTPEDQYEALPLVDKSGNYAITADARIDNRDELIETLNVREPEDRPITDTELILAAYMKWGRDCPEKLLGAFAFAAWDRRERTLMLARDHFGMRPLSYIHQPGDVFAFASEEKALLEAGLSDGKINEQKIADFLMLPVEIDAGATYWSDIFSVRRAHTLDVSPSGNLREEEYWALDPDSETHLGSDGAYIERFREIFREAVRCRMRSSTPVGSSLSGGLDSTSIACIAAQELNGEKLHTLSAVYPDIPEADEREYQEAALEMYQDTMEPMFVTPTETSPLEYQDWFTQYLGRPNSGINAYITIELHRRAAQKGLRVVLSGNDGDTVISHGHAYYEELLWSWRWITLWREIRGTLNGIGGDREDLHRALRGWIKHYFRHNPFLRPFVKVWQASRRLVQGEGAERKQSGLRSGAGAMWRSGWQPFFDDAFVSRVESYIKTQNDRNIWKKERHHHYMLLTRPLMEDVFRMFDAMGSALEMEVRFPFHDVRLVEFCLSLPGHLKQRKEKTRWIEHASMDGILPSKVMKRNDKADVREAYINGLVEKEKEALLSFEEVISSGGSRICNYVDSDRISQLARKMADGHLSDHDQEPSRVLLWRAMSLHRWFELEESKSPQSVGCETV